MKHGHALVLAGGSRISPWLLICGALVLNRVWRSTLASFDTQFQQVAGYPLLDLQTITPAQMQQQIAAYTSQAKTLYWAFFAVDNIIPPLLFTLYALVIVYFLRSNPNRAYNRLLHSWVVLIPLGVGFFDWLENIAYVAAMYATGGPIVLAFIYIGLLFKWLKVACIIPTFLLMLPLAIYHVYRVVRQHVARVYSSFHS